MYVGEGNYDGVANNDDVDRWVAVELAPFCSRWYDDHDDDNDDDNQDDNNDDNIDRWAVKELVWWW